MKATVGSFTAAWKKQNVLLKILLLLFSAIVVVVACLLFGVMFATYTYAFQGVGTSLLFLSIGAFLLLYWRNTNFTGLLFLALIVMLAISILWSFAGIAGVHVSFPWDKPSSTPTAAQFETCDQHGQTYDQGAFKCARVSIGSKGNPVSSTDGKFKDWGPDNKKGTALVIMDVRKLK